MARPAHNKDLHHNVPQECDTAVLLIDVFNTFDFEGGAALANETEGILKNLLALRKRATASGVPVIYINDNAGLWRSDSSFVIGRACAKGSRGRSIAMRLCPRRKDFIILKPKQSAFYATPLETLLDYLKVRCLVIAGLTADICIYFTAQDAFVRDYELWIPSDGTASQAQAKTIDALAAMKQNFNARVLPCAEIPFSKSRRRSEGRSPA
jgi:nicotinamidase-related amidase